MKPGKRWLRCPAWSISPWNNNPTCHRVRFQRDAIADYGLTVHEAASHLAAALKGIKASLVLEERNAFDLVIRLAPELEFRENAFSQTGWRIETIFID